MPHRLIYLNNLSSVDGSTWDGLEGVALREEVRPWGGFEVSTAHAVPS